LIAYKWSNFTILKTDNLKPLRLIGFCACLLLAITSVWANPADSTKPRFWRKFHPDSSHLKWLPIPAIQVGPEVGVGFGASLDYFFNFRNDDDSTDRTRESFVWLQGLYSTRQQFISDLRWQVYAPRERYVTRGNIGFVDFNEYFWGIGNNVLGLDNQILAYYQRFFIQSRIWQRIGNQYFAGISFNFSQTKDINFDLETNAISFVENLNGSTESRVSGVGGSFLADFRDNLYSPTRGWYAEITPVWHRKWLGSDFEYLDFQLDLRKYHELSAKDFLGAQVFANFTEGVVPWRELPRLGNVNLMRGFTAGRYRDAQFAATQMEYRREINHFLVAAAFVSTGQVAAKIKDFSYENWRIAGGGGLRVLINKRRNLFLRLDYARSTEGDSGFYFRLGDAF
jgi:outer membrane translocation and assembly module TamA